MIVQLIEYKNHLYNIIVAFPLQRQRYPQCILPQKEPEEDYHF